jgi:AbrB family looped-hinge helix DNA binding protein
MLDELNFVARVEKGFRVFIPRAVREVLGLEEGDYVEITIKKVKEGGGRKLTRRP